MSAVIGYFTGLACGLVLGVMLVLAYGYGVARWLTKDPDA